MLFTIYYFCGTHDRPTDPWLENPAAEATVTEQIFTALLLVGCLTGNI